MLNNAELVAGVVVAVVSLSVLVVLLNGLFRHLSPTFGREPHEVTTTEPAEPRKAPAWTYVFLIAIVALLTYVCTRKVRNPPPLPDAANGSLLRFVLVLPTFFLLGFLYLFLKRDKIVSLAWKRSKAGDREGAIELLRDAIEAGRPTETRCNNLGALYAEAGDHASALKMYVDAEKLGGRQAIYMLNQACSLNELGRPADALDLLAELKVTGTAAFVHACHSAVSLALLGQFEESSEAIARAEAIPLRSLPGFSAEGRDQQIRRCRDRLDAAIVRAASDPDCENELSG